MQSFSNLSLASQMRHLAGNTAQGHFSKKTEEKITSSRYFNSVAGDLTYKDLNNHIKLETLNGWEHAAIGHRDGGQQDFAILKDTLRLFFKSTDRNFEVNYMKTIYDNYIAESGNHHHLGQIPAVKKLIYTVFMSKVEELRHESGFFSNKQHVQLKDELEKYFTTPLEEIITPVANRLREVTDSLQGIGRIDPGISAMSRLGARLAINPGNTSVIPADTNSSQDKVGLLSYNEANKQLNAPPSYPNPPDYDDIAVNQKYEQCRNVLAVLAQENISFSVPLPNLKASNEEHASFLSKLTQQVQENIDKIRPQVVLNNLLPLLPDLDVTNVRARVALLDRLKNAAIHLPDEAPLKVTLGNLNKMTSLRGLQDYEQDLKQYLDTNFYQLNLAQLRGLRSYLAENKQQELDKYSAIINRLSNDYQSLLDAGLKAGLEISVLRQNQLLQRNYSKDFLPVRTLVSNLEERLIGVGQGSFKNAKEIVDGLLNEFDRAYNTHLPNYIYELESIQGLKTDERFSRHRNMVSDFFISIARIVLEKSDADIVQTLKNQIDARPENDVESKRNTKAKLDELNAKQRQLLTECQTKLTPALKEEAEGLLERIDGIKKAVDDLVGVLPNVSNNGDERVVFTNQLATIQQTLQNFTWDENNEAKYDQITKSLNDVINSLNKTLHIYELTTKVSVLEMEHKPKAEDFESNQIIVCGQRAYFKHVDTNQVQCLNDKFLPGFPKPQQFSLEALVNYINNGNNRNALMNAGVISRPISSSITNLNDIIKNLGVIVTNEITEVQRVLKQYNELDSLLGAFATKLTNNETIKIEDLRKIDDLVNKMFNNNIPIKKSIRTFVLSHLQYSTLSQLYEEQRQSFDRLSSSPTTAENIDEQIAGLCDIYSQQVALNSLVNTGDPDLTHANLLAYAGANAINTTLNAYKENYNRAASMINNSVTQINNELTRSQFDESTTQSIVGILSALTTATQEQAKNAGINLNSVHQYDIRTHVDTNNGMINAVHILKSLYYNFLLSHHIADKVKGITKRLFTGIEYFGQSKDFQHAVSALSNHATDKITRRSKIGSINLSERTRSEVTIPKFDPNRNELPEDIAKFMVGQEKLKEAKSRLSSTPNIFANPDKGLEGSVVPEQIKIPEPEALDENSQVVNDLLLSFVVSAPDLTDVIQFAEGYKLPAKDLPSHTHGTTVIQILDTWCTQLAEFEKYDADKKTGKAENGNNLAIVKDFWELSRKVFNLLITVRTMMVVNSSSSKPQTDELVKILTDLWKPATYSNGIIGKMRTAISPKGQTGKTEFYYVFAGLFGENLDWIQANIDGAKKSAIDSKVKSASRQEQIRHFTAQMLKNQPNDVAKHYADLTTLISFDPNRGAGFRSLPIILA